LTFSLVPFCVLAHVVINQQHILFQVILFGWQWTAQNSLKSNSRMLMEYNEPMTHMVGFFL